MLGTRRSREDAFLVRMGEEIGYNIESETGKVDQVWRDERGTNVVALEHENDWRTIDNELEKHFRRRRVSWCATTTIQITTDAPIQPHAQRVQSTMSAPSKWKLVTQFEST